MVLTFKVSGVLHASYLIHCLVVLCCKHAPSSKETHRFFSHVFFYGRVLMSLVLLGSSLDVVSTALFQENIQLKSKYPGIPHREAVFVLLFYLCLVCMLKEMKHAFYSVAKLPAMKHNTSLFGTKMCALFLGGNN